MEARGFYHEGMLALQEHADGRRLADFLATSARHSEFSERDAAQITAASFFFKTLPAVVPHLPRSDARGVMSSSPVTIGQRDA
ncbi:hypothetical protein [uncultured Bradyrhizobium sp.]|uniref:hypothetical protein n=1 Tax=Bradyrhizobium sp. TaxID=376 RepID=UPI0026067C1B|nr:hypothetical protein [uncultured Bradyrhizobium sp.]